MPKFKWERSLKWAKKLTWYRFNQDCESKLGNDTFFHGSECIQEIFVLKLPGLKLEEGLEKPWDFLEEVENERNHVYGA